MEKVNFLDKYSKFLAKKGFLIVIFVFVLIFLFYFSLQLSPTFPDPDSFYHAKIAKLMEERGIIKDFPWLQHTVLKNYYADHHFLYHAILIPFILFLNPLVGIKLATLFLALLFLFFLYWFLKQNKVKWPLFYIIVLSINYSFALRMNLAKASSLSLILLLLAFYFIFKRKYFYLFLLSFFYVWSYGGWPLIFLAAIVFVAASSLLDAFIFISAKPNFNFKRIFKNFIITSFKEFFKKENIKLLASCLAGILAGLFINPFFPQNLHFYWQQIFKIAVVNYQETIGVGAEWYGYNFFEFLGGNFIIFTLFLLGFLALFFNFFYSLKNKKFEKDFFAKTLTFLLMSLLFLFLTIRSRRNIEYFLPLAILFSSFSLTSFVNNFGFQKIKREILPLFRKKKLLLAVIIIYFLIASLFVSVRDIIRVEKYFYSGFPAARYKGASDWLVENTPRGSIVFNGDWDDFPMLFYHNSHNYYIVGLDATFMYEYDNDLYWQWANTTLGKIDKNLYGIVKGKFGADYVFMDSDHKKMQLNFIRDPHFKTVYHDEECTVFGLRK